MVGKVDLNAIRAEYEAKINKDTKKEGNNNDAFLNKFIKLEEGTNVVRVLPPKEEGKPFYSFSRIHRLPMEDGNEYNYHCLRSHNKKAVCPVCNYYFDLWKRINNGEQELRPFANKISAKVRYYLNVVDRRDNKVKILSCGTKIFDDKIMPTMVDPDFGDITDLQEGFDFKIIKKTEKTSAGIFPNYDQSSPKPVKTPAGTSAEIARFIEEMHDLESMIKVPTPEDYTIGKRFAEELALKNKVSPPEKAEPTATSAPVEAKPSPIGDTKSYIETLKS